MGAHFGIHELANRLKLLFNSPSYNNDKQQNTKKKRQTRDLFSTDKKIRGFGLSRKTNWPDLLQNAYPTVFFKKMFRLHEELMKKTGLRSFDNYPRLFPFYAWGLYLIFVIPVPSLVFYHYMHAEPEEKSRIYSNIHMVLEIFALTIKVCPFKKNPQSFINSMNVWKNGIDESYSKLDADILKEGERIHTLVFKFFIVNVINALICFLIQQVLSSVRQLPCNIVMPFDALSNTAVYYGVSIYLHLTIFHTAMTHMCIDTLLPALLYHSAMQIKIVKKRLQYMEIYIEDDLDKVAGQLTEYELKVYTNKLIHEKIRGCTDLTVKVIKYVKETEDLFSLPAFTQFFFHAIVISSILLNLWNLPLKSLDTLTFVLFLIPVTIQIFVYCHSGTLLLEESKTLPDAIFFSNWTEYSEENKKSLIILMERAKKPIRVIAGKLIPLDLKTFALIMKRSYTLLAVLKNFSRK